MDNLWQDLRYALRVLRARPGFTAVAVLTLALGIGANTAIFSVVHAALLRPLPFRDAEQLVMAFVKTSQVPRGWVAYPDYQDWQAQSQSFAALSAFVPQSVNFTGRGEPTRLIGGFVSADFFPMLGIEAAAGRLFLPGEDRPGAERVAVLSHGAWQAFLGGDPDLIGQTLNLNGQPFTVVGVTPEGFRYPDNDIEVWLPIQHYPNFTLDRRQGSAAVIGRLKPGVTLRQAQAEMDAIAARLAAQYPETNADRRVNLMTWHETIVENLRPALLLLLAAVGLTLLIACANVANLLLARLLARRRELALRMALGAGRWRLARQMLTENLLLALIGGGGGLLLAAWGTGLILAFNSAQLPRLEQVSMDGRVLLFALGISLLTAVIFGLLPAAQFSRLDLHSGLKEGGRAASPGPAWRGLRNALVIAEIALALVLLTGAGLLVRSFVNLLRVDPGFAPERVLALQVFLGGRNYQKPEQAAAFFDQTLDKVAAVPGVQAAAAVASPPFINLEQDAPFTVEGRPALPSGQEPSAFYTEVSADYLGVMSVPLRQGRFFTRFDGRDAAPVMVINETMARAFFPGEDPVGKRLTVMYDRPVTRDIVGVVGDVLRHGLDSAPRPEMFVPHPQDPSTQMTFMVRTAADPAPMLEAVKAAIREVNPNQTFARTATMEQLVADSLHQRRFNLFLLGAFAALALLLAGVGIYGLVSYSTRQRSHEIGVRIALGAQRRDILRMIVGQGLALTLAGIGLGIAGALLLTRLMTGLLFGVSAADPLTFGVIALLLAGVALLACYIPARRATQVDPMAALRRE